jgi:hypothetical protein
MQLPDLPMSHLTSAQPGALRRIPQHLAEVGVSVSRLHVPQRPAEPRPHLLQVRHVRPDRGISQPGRRPGQDEPGQHVSLERRQLTRPGRGTRWAHHDQEVPAFACG